MIRGRKQTGNVLKGALGQREDLYDTAVLVDNWYENRFSNKTDRHAITPCIYGESTCQLGSSTYADNYTPKVKGNSPDDVNEFIQVKHLAFGNRMRSHETNIKLYDGEPFMRNMTTMTDILYRLKPQEAMKAGEFDILRPRVKEDLLRGCGNLTNTGLSLWMRCEGERNAQRRIDMSTYKELFTPKVGERSLRGKKKF